jgi:hypothetical protein
MLKEMTLCEEVFHTTGGVAYADFITDGHRETWPIRSRRKRSSSGLSWPMPIPTRAEPGSSTAIGICKKLGNAVRLHPAQQI